MTRTTRKQRGSGRTKRRKSDGDIRRERMLEKNRDAAERCRAKKKVEEEYLREHTRELEASNAQLQVVVQALRHEVLVLKEECLKYINCSCNSGCGRVREYLLQRVDAATLSTTGSSSLTNSAPTSPVGALPSRTAAVEFE